MNTYVIVRDDGQYVTLGSKRSYTTRLEYARRWKSAKEAEAECCPENERVVSVEALLTYPY